MRNRLPYALAALVLLAACPGAEPNPVNPVDAGHDATLDEPDTTDNDSGDVGPSTFEFGFEAVPFLAGLTGVHQASVVFDGERRSGQFFLLDGAANAVGSLSFEVDGRSYSYRLQGVIEPRGELLLALTERSCSEGTVACDDVPDVLRESMVYDAVGRFDGIEVIFAPLAVRPEARALASDFVFAPPVDGRMTPNDGFKPAQIPDPVAIWDGRITFFPAGMALSGDLPCQVEIARPQIPTYELISMNCNGTSYVLDADPGPDRSSLDVNEIAGTVTFDFVDGGQRWTIAGYLGEGTLAGVVVEADRYDELGSPLDATVADIDGLFYFDATF